MSTYNTNLPGASGTALADKFAPGCYPLRRTIDLSSESSDESATGGFDTSDVLEALRIPAGTAVLGCTLQVHVAEGATCTVDIGVTGDDADGFMNDVNLNSTSTFDYTAHDDGYGVDNMQFKFFSTADTIDVLFNNDDCNAAVFTLTAICVDCSRHDYSA